MLKRGMEGGDVRSAMLLMKDKGYYPYAIPVSDKLFGAKMEAGLRKMQGRPRPRRGRYPGGRQLGLSAGAIRIKVRAHSLRCVL